MADAVITTKITIDGKEYTASLNDARRQTQAFSRDAKGARTSLSGMSGALGSVKGALAPLAIATAAAATAFKGYKAVADSSQSASDSFARSLEGVKSGFNEMMKTLSTGDWSGFFSNIDHAIKKARDLYDTMDKIGDMEAAYRFNLASTDLELKKAKDVVYDSEATDEQKRAAAKKLRKGMQELKTQAEEIGREYGKAIQQAFSKVAGMEVSEDDLTRYFETASRHADPAFEQFSRKYSKLLKDTRATVSMAGGFGAAYKSGAQEKSPEERQLEALRKMHPEYVKLYNINNRITDEEREHIVGLKEREAQLLGRSYEYSSMLHRLERRIDKGRTTAEPSARLTPAPEKNELQRIQEEINTLRTKLIGDISHTARTGIWQSIRELESRKVQLEARMSIDPRVVEQESRKAAEVINKGLEDVPSRLSISISVIGEYERQIRDLKRVLEYTADPQRRDALSGQIEALTRKKDREVERAGLKVKAPALTQMLKTYASTADETLEKNLQLVQSFGALADGVAAVAGATESSAAAWVRWGAGVVNALGQALPMIQASIALQRQKTTADAQGAAAAAGKAVAGIPVVGPVMALGAIASVIAAIMSVPKFAEGGIVGGNSYTGDRILARLNSGEMVLNRRQQGVLSRALESPSSPPANVEFRIRGEELYGVLSRYGRTNERL